MSIVHVRAYSRKKENMARINVEESIWSDPRYLKLVLKCGDEAKAIGQLVIAWRFAQKFWCDNKKPIPLKEWEFSKLNNDLIELGFAEKRDDGIYMSGSAKSFQWKNDLLEGNSKGGLRSSKRPRDKKGRLLSKSNPSQTQVDPSLSSVPYPIPSPLPSLKNFLTVEKDNSLNYETVIKEPNSLPADPPKAYPGREFVKVYISAFQKRYGSNTRPSLDGKVQGLIKNLLKTTPLERAKNLIEVYFQMDDKWFETKTHDFVTFMSNLDKIGIALDTGMKTNSLDFSFMEKK